MKSAKLKSSTGGYDPFFFDRLAAIEDRHFWFCARDRVIFELANRIASRMEPGHLVLEVGCGTGNVLRALVKAFPHGKVVGLDLWFHGLCHAQKRFGGLLVQGDARSFPFRKQFDLIGAFDVIEHIPEDVETLIALRRLLTPNGELMLTVPAHQYLWSYFDEAAFHCRRYSAEELRVKLNEAGFTVEFLSQYMFTIWPLVWAFRKLSGIFKPRQPNGARALSEKEFRIVPVVNGLLKFLLGLEARWLAAGRTLPLGTSLIAVARPAK
jgi:SAM-dependent methyltransferase